MAGDYRSGVDTQNAEDFGWGNTLKQLQALTDRNQRQAQIEAQQQHDTQRQQQEHELKQKGGQENLQTLLSLRKQGILPDNIGATIGSDSASLTHLPAVGMYDIKKENMDRRGQAEYSKRLEKLTGFSSALQDIENLTNRSGKGGILTNEKEGLQSAGALKSAVPTTVLGLAEAVGMSPKGGAEERKALERLQLEYQKAMTGARTSEEMSRREKQAMGWITSGDSSLVAKGVRALAHNVKRATKTIQSGYPTEVQGRVHDQMGDPMEFLNRVHEDSALPAMNNSQAPSSAPQPVAAPAKSSGDPIQDELRKRGLIK